MPTEERHNYALWLGPLLGLLGVVGYFALIIQVGWRSLSDMPWPNLLSVAAGVVLSVLGAVSAWQATPASNLKRSLSVLGVGFSGFAAYALVAYLFVGSASLPSSANAAPTGDPLPAVTTSLLDNHGKAFDLAGVAGGDLVLVFFRGHW